MIPNDRNARGWSRRIVALIATGALALGACSGGGSDEALAPEAEIAVGLGGDPMTMNPFDFRGGVNFYGIEQMYERLLSRSTDGELQPALAKSWDVSEDGRTYTFELRDDVVFHSGQPMTSADVKFSIERFADPEIMPYAYMLGALDSIDTPDDHTVVVNFSEPAPVFLTGAGMAYIIPASVGDEAPDFLDAQADGTGALKMVSRSVGQGFQLERFDDYWGETSGFAKIDVKVIPDANARVSALRSGQVDFIVPVPTQNVAQLEKDFTVEVANDSNSVGIGFDLLAPGEAGVVEDERVRRAMDLAIDRQAVVDAALNGYAQVHGGVGPQNTGGDRVPAVEQDLDAARALIEEAGAVGETVALYVPTNGRITSSEQVGQAVTGFWEEIGLKTDLKIVSYEEWIDRIRNGPAQTYLTFQGDEIAWSPLPRLHGYYGCEGSTGHVCDEEFDDIVQRTEVAQSLDDYVDGYVEAFTLLQEKALGIQMYVQESAYAMNPQVCWEPTVGRSIPDFALLQPCS